MKQRKQKKLVFWLGVIFIGVALGLALQFVRAWTEPTEAPPGGNLGAPINTGASIQTKTGTATQKADICVDANGTGDKKCLSSLVAFPACTLAGGMPTMVDGVTLCKFPGASCPAPWKQYPNAPAVPYTETIANSCTGGGSCGTSVTSGSHSFDNIDPVTEAKTYYDGNQTAYSCQAPWCVTGCACNGYPYDTRCCCYFPTTTCWTSCSSTAKNCSSTVTTIGCIQ